MFRAIPTTTLTMMTTTDRTGCIESEFTGFLADYAAAMLGCGATCVRIEKNVGRIAARFGIGADITVMPAHVQISTWSRERPCGEVAVRRISPGAIDFDRNARLSRLSWDVADGKLDFDRMTARFDAIKRIAPGCRTRVLLLAALANASFCRLFGGDAAAMLTVFAATIGGMCLKQMMTARGADTRVTVFCAAFFSTALSAAGYVFGFGETPGIALGAGVLYLIPGVPYINSVSDIIDRHYLCAFSRLTDAMVTTFCLSAGLCLATLVLGLKWF